MQPRTPHTILIVDDEALHRTLLRTSLTEAGYAVQEAETGQQALALLAAEPIDVVLLDLVMPEMDGFRVLKEIRSDRRLRSIPVVVVSASDDMESVVRSIEMGAVDHLCKPFDSVLLHARVRSALAVKQAQLLEPPLQGAISGEDTSKTPAAGTDEESEFEERMGVIDFGRRLAGWTRPYLKQLIFFLIIMVVSLGVEAGLPLGFKYIMDNALIPHNLHVLVFVITVLLILAFGSTALQVLGDFLYAHMGTKILNDLRFNMYRHLQRLSTSYYKRVPAGEITSRFTTDLASVDNTIMMALPATISNLIILLSTLAMLFVLEWRLAMFSLLGLYVCFKGDQWIEPRVSQANYRMKNQQAKITSMLQENVQGHSVIKIFRLQGMLVEKFKHRILDLYRTSARAGFLGYMTERVAGQSILLFGLITICLGAFLVFYGFLTIGELVSFQVLLTGLTAAVEDFTWGLPHLLQAAAGMERIDGLMGEIPEVTDAPEAVSIPRPTGEIALSGVNFGYTADRLILDNVSMAIPVNRNVLLVGPSGCGKSTVLNLIMRFYDPSAGKVTVDGLDLRKISQDSLRQHMSVVLQENFLFNASIRENIRMGKRDATDAEVEAAAVAAEIHEAILQMPEGYDTIAGESGGVLSGGQRQRIAIARAIISDPAILLLDEATSALDPVTATAINRALEKVARGRTMISVTHRLEHAPSTDLIFVFKNGRLAEHGHHQALLQNNGLYASLWRKQSGFLLDESGDRAGVSAERLRDIPILSNLDDDTLTSLAQLFVTEHYEPERIVVREGDPGERFYIIVRGRVSISKQTRDQEETRLAVLEDGDYFGEIALLRKVPRAATVTTLTRCILLALPGEHFQRLMESDPELKETLEQVVDKRQGGE